MSLYKVKSSNKKYSDNNDFDNDYDNHSVNSNNSYKGYNPNNIKNQQQNYNPNNNNNINFQQNKNKNNEPIQTVIIPKNTDPQNNKWKNIVLKNIDKPIVNNLKKEEKKEQKTLSYNEYYDYCWDYDERFSLFHGTEVLNIALDFEDIIYEYKLPIFDNASNGNNKYVFEFLLNNSFEGLNIIKETDEFNNELKKEYSQEFLEEEEYNQYHKDD